VCMWGTVAYDSCPMVWFVGLKKCNGSGFMVYGVRGVVLRPVLERVES
jgi:hypothetical protein